MILSLIGWIVFGLIIGAIARLLVPGDQGLSLFKTMLVGIVGSFIGGFIGYMIAGGEPLQASGLIGSVVGSVILLLIVGRSRRIEAT